MLRCGNLGDTFRNNAVTLAEDVGLRILRKGILIEDVIPLMSAS